MHADTSSRLPPKPSCHRDLLVLAVGIVLLLAWDTTGLDMTLSGWFGTAAGFPLRDHVITAGLLHRGGRWLSVALFVLTAVACVRPFGPWRGLSRIERAWWFGATVVCLVLIPEIKHHSATSCPWDLQVFGGTAQHLSHWQGLWSRAGGDGGPGHCFPSGHASGAFSFLAIGVVLRRQAPRAARRWMLALIGLGLVFGVAQMARGAHFASHTLYTAWICAAITLPSWHLMQRLRERQPTPLPQADA